MKAAIKLVVFLFYKKIKKEGKKYERKRINGKKKRATS